MTTDKDEVKIRLEVITLIANKLTELLSSNLFIEELYYEVEWIVKSAMESKGIMLDANQELKFQLVDSFQTLLDTYAKM